MPCMETQNWVNIGSSNHLVPDGTKHYLNQCWLLICEVLWCSATSNFTWVLKQLFLYDEFEIYPFKITTVCPRGQWVKPEPDPSLTLLAITPSLSSSASLRINSNNFSRCFLLAFTQLPWKQSNRWSNCSGEKSHANLANKSWTFFTIASCFPAWASQILSRSWSVRAFSLIMNRMIFSSFSTYWGWCRLSRRTIDSTLFCWIHSWNTKKGTK